MTVFGFGLTAAAGEVGTLLAHAERADRDGLDLVTLSDHPTVRDRVDAYAALGFVLGRTARVRGAVNVTNLPSRPVPMLARTLSTLELLAPGRVVLGIGAGGAAPDTARLGIAPVSPAAAVRAMEEAITLVRRLCGGGEPVTFDGEFSTVDALPPASVAAPPVWTGSLGPRSLEVTGRLADGWIPGRAADWLSARYRESRPVIDEAAVAAGRDPGDVVTIYNLQGRITAAPLRATRDDDGRWVGGSAGQWVAELTSAVAEHGAGGFTLFPVGEVDAALGVWAQEIVPAVRAALSGR